MKAKSKGLLEDIFVLDLADEQGSYCSKLLADLGATVAKVETLGRKFESRFGPSHHTEASFGRTSLSFYYHNTNKLGIILDLGSRKGIQVMRRLVKRADILVETFPQNRLGSLKLGNAQLQQINPRLIHISITGFGRTGPRSSFHSSNSIASAYGGQMYVTGKSTGPPVELSGMQSYYTASLFAANAALLCLMSRKKTGRGRYVDLSIQEAVASTLDHVMIDFFHNGNIEERGRHSDSIDSFDIFQCRDGYIQIPTMKNCETLVDLINADGLPIDRPEKKLERESSRKKHLEQMVEAVMQWTQKQSKLKLFRLGRAMRFPWAPIFNLEDVLKSPQLKARRFLCPLKIPGSTCTIPVPDSPYKFSSRFCVGRKPPPLPGKHAEDILHMLGSGGTNDNELSIADKESDPSVKCGNILSEIRVVDLTRMLAGPYATRILGDFGAEVIKVQSKWTAQGAERNDTPYFCAWNRNKRSICLNLNYPEARNLLLELIAASDIVVENYTPRVLANWGLGYRQMKKAKPDIIVASISAMGQTGPWKDSVGFAPNFHALSGLLSASSPASGEPIHIRHAYGDIIAALYASMAILASLEHRNKTGRGQYIDISAYEAMCSLLGPELMKTHLMEHQKHLGDRCKVKDTDLLRGCYPCAGNDRWCVIVISNQGQWQALCRISAIAGLKDDRFQTPAGRKKNRLQLDELISGWTIRHSAETIALRLQKAGVAAGVVQNAKDLAVDPQLAARRFFTSLKHPELGKVYSDRSALWPWGEEPLDWKAAPRLGQDNRYIFVDLLGHPESEFQSLIRKGVIQ